MRSTTSVPRFCSRRRRGVSSVVGAVFFVLIMMVAIGALVTIFNSFNGYQADVNKAGAAQLQNQQTQLSFPQFQFGSPVSPVSLASGGSTAASATGYSSQNKLLYGGGLWWSLYSDGTNVVCKNSVDGLNWGSATSIASPPASATTLRNSAKQVNCNTNTCSENIGGSQTAGDILALALGWYGGPAPTSVTDSLGDTYTAGVTSSVGIPVAPTLTSGANEVSCNKRTCIVGLGGTMTAGDVLVYTIGWATTAAPTISDSLGNSWTLGVSSSVVAGRTTYYSSVYYATDATTGGGEAITATFGSNTNAMASAYDVTGATAIGLQTSTGSSSAAAGTASVASFAPATGSFVVAQVEASANVNPWTPGAGYTIQGGSGPCNKSPGCTQYETPSSGSTTAPMTMSPNVSFVEVAVSFPAATSFTYYSSVYYATSGSSGGVTITATFAAATNAMASAYDVTGVVSQGPQTSTGVSSASVAASSVTSFSPVANSFVIADVEANANINPWGQGAGYSIIGGAGSCNNTPGCSQYETGTGGSTTAPLAMVPSAGFAETAIAFRPSAYNEGYAIAAYLAGTTLYLSIGQDPGGASTAFQWRYGAIGSSGCASISWTIPLTAVTTSYPAVGPVSVETDAYGNTWVALTTLTGSTYHDEVWEHAAGAAAGTWTKQDDITSGSTEGMAMVDPWACSGSGCAVLVYGSALAGGGATSVVSTTCTPSCSSWTSPVSAPSDYIIASSDAVTIGSTLYFAGLASSSGTSGTLNFWSLPIGSGSSITETTIEAASAPWEAALSYSSTTLVLFEATSSGSTLYVRSSLDYGSTWFPSVGSTAFVASSSESSITGLTAAYSGSFAAMWTSGASSPYNLRYFSLSMFSVVDASPFAVDAVSLYVSQPSSNALVQHYDSTGATPGAAGPFDAWVGSGAEMDIPLIPNYGGVVFDWSTSTSYVVTVTTGAGVVDSETVASPA